MEQNGVLNNVISLNKKIADKNRACGKEKSRGSNAKIIAITSGKGGVGKTNIVANLGFALSRLGKKVLIFDADLGLGNLDILLGLAPKYNLSHVIMGDKTVSEILIKGPGGIRILPASSGIQELTELTESQTARIFSELETLMDSTDILLIDTAAGISSNVLYFNFIAQEIVVVVSPEPTSITDAYALMKVLSIKYSEKKFKLLVNMVADEQEAKEVFRQLNLVAGQFLDISIEYFGHVLSDKNVTRCVKSQKLISEIYPDFPASSCFKSLAKKINSFPAPLSLKEAKNIFQRSILINKQDRAESD